MEDNLKLNLDKFEHNIYEFWYNKSLTLDIDDQFLINKKNWLYSFSENFSTFSYDIIYYIYNNYFFQNNNIFNKIYIKHVLCSDFYNLLYSILLDKLYFVLIFSLPFFNFFYNHLFDYINFNTIIITNPEYFFIINDYIQYYTNLYLSNLYLSINLITLNESFITPSVKVIEFIFLYMLVLSFLLNYFNYFNNMVLEDNIVDHDFLIFNVTLEAEEEIGSVDDMILALVIIIYIYFWFFWVDSWSLISITSHLKMSICLFPLLYFIIFLIPVFLLYNNGSYFLTFLNGVGKSSVLMIELLFDYIAASIFFLRLIVQNVRLIFMLFTFSELHELVLLYVTNSNIIPGNEDFIVSWDFIKSSVVSFSYWLVSGFPTSLLNWLYELFHTFFMIIFQFIAFFAMVFWLFLFLYTMFVAELQEGYFSSKRLFRKKYFEKLLSYRLNFLI